ncbi:hypothetical protein HOD30_02930 [Candidatus Peregrinibacteria bacterium]|jgi:hypothetical protein|nr:hypothetical protein [Candidatus Peregrinibacteria bacterium]MBT4632048.1 hypothetical protein [Candidatus Peregrinibacteria bacterium]MBT5516395.1 hypothetical protein [Candidatus Peregrinibacteria bacterium]MBT5824428.1 hypothetical protein [Candidatus Peregrinibacteria bacterium]
MAIVGPGGASSGNTISSFLDRVDDYPCPARRPKAAVTSEKAKVLVAEPEVVDETISVREATDGVIDLDNLDQYLEVS